MNWRERRDRRKGLNVVPMITKEAGTIPASSIIVARPRPRIIVSAIGAGLGLTSLGMNLTYAIGQGTSLADQISWASGAGLIEALSLVMPSLALDFWRQRQRLAGLACASIAIGSIALATWSNLDYIKQGTGDHIVSRAAIAEQREGLRAKIALAQNERSSITEVRGVDEINAAISRLRVWPWAAAETTNCTRPGSDIAERQCAPMKRLAEARATARHRDELDSALARDRAALSALPPISTTAPDPIRIILFALVPGALAGPVLMLARW
jgi:hypothetical protein